MSIDIELFRTWDSIFSIRALRYLKNPIEVLRNTMHETIIIYLTGLIILYIVYTRLFDFLVKDRIDKIHQTPFWLKSLTVVLLAGFSFLGFRGGFRQIPRNQSDAYFCGNKTYNISSINSTWNFFNIIFQNKKLGLENPYIKMDIQTAQALVDEMFATGNKTQSGIFNSSEVPPNIVLITMEGISAELMNNQFDRSHLKFIQRIQDSAYSFQKAYAIGFRTEQGIAALLSGTLSTPYTNRTDDVNRLPELPSIIRSMKSRKYSTTFLFGGDVEFANTRAYLHEMGMENIYDINDFPKSSRLQKLGVPDEILFERAVNEIKLLKSPYFLHIMTQSTHQPFDIPGKIVSRDADRAYEESAEYLDHCIEKFINKLKTNDQWKNTIVIITSDHAHNYPSTIDIATRERYHIPLLIISPLLKTEYIGAKDSLIFAQNDFPASFCHWLGWKEKNYLPYSKNHFSNSKKFCFSTFVNGYVFQMDTHRLEFDYTWRPIDTTNQDIVKLHSVPMAIMQILAEEIRGITYAKEKHKAR